jgi:hypothetical protein
LSRICIICAAPRSGTNALGSAVAGAFRAAFIGEIFHHINAKPGANFRNSEDEGLRSSFFNFRADALQKNPGLVYPSLEARRSLFDRYIEHLQQAFQNDCLLLDVKYSSWHHLDGFWRNPLEPPGLVELIQEKAIPIVHLVRTNLFELYCSLQFAGRDGIWTIEKGEDIQPLESRTLRVDLEHCRVRMTNMAHTQRLFRGWFRDAPVQTLTYEGMLRDGRFDSGVAEMFSRLFGRPPVHALEAVYRKILPPLKTVIVNADEVVEYFTGTDFEEFVRSSLA